MKTSTTQKMDMYINKITRYAVYISCFSRIINEFVENGDENIEKNDLPNLCVLMTKFAKRMECLAINMGSDWEFKQ